MPGKAFFDTNVLIYAVAHNEPRSTQAEQLLASGGVLSVQILNEFASVARRKILMSWSEVTEALDAFRVLCPSPLPITIEMHEAALKIAEKHGFNSSPSIPGSVPGPQSRQQQMLCTPANATVSGSVTGNKQGRELTHERTGQSRRWLGNS